MVAILVMLSVTMNAQIKNPKTETVKIYGNCGMCKKTIEKAANITDESLVVWDKETKIATVTYDREITTQEAILKRIAAAGYNSNTFQATNEAYDDLLGCCQYDRKVVTEIEK